MSETREDGALPPVEEMRDVRDYGIRGRSLIRLRLIIGGGVDEIDRLCAEVERLTAENERLRGAFEPDDAAQTAALQRNRLARLSHRAYLANRTPR